MEKKKVIVLLVVVAIIFGIGEYFLGSAGIVNKNYDEAYQQGWSYWFSTYGSHHEGMDYIDYYDMGRNYDSDFDDNFDAFETGFKDAFYFVNHSEPDESYNDRIQKGYTLYYGDKK